MLSVLLVESHADTRDLYAEFLGLIGFRVCTAPDTNVACHLAREVDAVVTGSRLPGRMDGLALVRHLRADPRTEDLAILVLSASAFATDAAAARSAGCDVFLSKPCMPSDLATEIRHAVLMRRRINPSAAAKTQLHVAWRRHSTL
jgi:CheY-like chemotaxis protein